MPKIQGVIFDWDGVIVDSMPIIALGIQEAANSYGANVSADDVQDGYFQPRHAYYESLGIDTSDKEELNRRHFAAILKHRKPAPIFPEVARVLKLLVKRNCKLAVASTADTVHIIQQLDLFELSNVFPTSLILGGEMAKEDKLQSLVNEFGLDKTSVMYVGDLPSDINAARAVDVLAAGIDRREKGRARLATLKPDYLFSSLNDLLKII